MTVHNGNGQARIFTTRVFEALVIGAMAAGAGMYVSVSILGTKLDFIDTQMAAVTATARKAESSLTGMRADVAILANSDLAVETALASLEARLKEVENRLRELELGARRRGD